MQVMLSLEGCATGRRPVDGQFSTDHVAVDTRRPRGTPIGVRPGPGCTHFAVSPLAHRVAHVGHARRRDGLHELDPDLAADGFE